MYPYPVLEDGFKFNTPHKVSDFHFRQLLYRRDHEENFSMVHPEIQGMDLRNVMRYYTSPTTPKLHVKNPVPVAFELLNKFGDYSAGIDQLQMHHPVLESMYSVKLLQRLITFPRDTTLTVNNPHEITFGGTVKPVLARPRLTGLTNQNNSKNAALSWEDSSVTHGGYYLYRSKSPIPIDLNIEPYQILDRTSRSFVDYYIDDMETYYYRITPISTYGELFSNLLKLDIPIHMGVPYSFDVDYDSHIPTSNERFELFTTKKTESQEIEYINRYDVRQKRSYYTGELVHTTPEYALDFSGHFWKAQAYAHDLEGHIYKAKFSYTNTYVTTQSGEFFNYTTLFSFNSSYSVDLILSQVDTVLTMSPHTKLRVDGTSTFISPYNFQLKPEEATNTVSFSGFLPPQNRSQRYDLLGLGGFLIPLHARTYNIKGNDVHATIYTRAFIDTSLKSGYSAPSGKDINITNVEES